MVIHNVNPLIIEGIDHLKFDINGEMEKCFLK